MAGYSPDRTDVIKPEKPVDLEAMSRPELIKIFEAIPKVDLHCHLDGSLRLETIRELSSDERLKKLAVEEDLQIPDEHLSGEELKELLSPPRESSSLVKYLSAFDYTKSIMQTPEALERTAYELAVDSAAENVWYLEARFAPLLHINRFQDGFEVLSSVDRGLERAEKELKGRIKTGIVVCAMRNFDRCLSLFHRTVRDHYTFSTETELAQSTALETARLAVRSRDRGIRRVVGFDLAGAEANYPPSRYTQAFYEIINNLLQITVHAGEAFGPDSIKQAVTYLNAVRIGHGTRLFDDRNDRLIKYLKDHRICVEACLTSNVDTGAVEKIEDHPFKEFLDEKLRVTLCTDNRLISDTTLSNEYLLGYEKFNLTPADIRRLSLYGFKSAFMDYDEKRASLINARVEMDRLGFFGEDYH